MKYILGRTGTFKFGRLFLRGAGSIFNIFGRYTPHMISSSTQDAAAVRNDWYTIGNDIKQAVGYGK